MVHPQTEVKIMAMTRTISSAKTMNARPELAVTPIAMMVIRAMKEPIMNMSPCAKLIMPIIP